MVIGFVMVTGILKMGPRHGAVYIPFWLCMKFGKTVHGVLFFPPISLYFLQLDVESNRNII